MADLAAKQAITEGLYRYCRGIDRMDREMVLAVWHEGGTADYSPFYSGTGAGFVDWVWEAHAGMERHSHQITNVLVEVSGDHATSESYVTVALRSRPQPDRVVEIVSRGRYLDRWSCRAGRWAIDHRRYVDDLQSVTEVASSAATDAATLSRRDRTDPSYEVLT